MPEIETRDRQSSNYLQHKKLPSQIRFFERFLKRIETKSKNKSVLDIGCGPGPTVRILKDFGYQKITAIDFSMKSLLINKKVNVNLNGTNWLKANLTDLLFEKKSGDILIMADFIQHLGIHEDKAELLINALSALKPGGYFYFSFFNFNLYNYLKGDLHGYFSNQTIPYERLIPSEIIILINQYVNVEYKYSMNIKRNYNIDSFFGKFPFTTYIARMFAIEGMKKK